MTWVTPELLIRYTRLSPTLATEARLPLMIARIKVVPGLPPIDFAGERHRVVGGGDSPAQRARRVAGGLGVQQRRHRRRHGRLGCLEAAFVTAHPVGEGEQRRSPTRPDVRIPDVLVLCAHRAAVGDPGDLECLTLAGDRPRSAVGGHAPAPASAAAG